VYNTKINKYGKETSAIKIRYTVFIVAYTDFKEIMVGEILKITYE